MNSIIRFFDKLEDKVRGRLRRYPLVYTFIGGVALVLFWRGVWNTADLFPFLTGPVTLVISLCVLLITGLFITFFINDQTILSGISQEKKIVQKTEAEVEQEAVVLQEMKQEMNEIKQELKHIEHKLDD